MAYQTYQVLIVSGNFSKYIDIVAISIESAKADIAAAYGDVTVTQWRIK